MIDEIVDIHRVQSDSLRYDIGVANNHNFYANNILVHNCQSIPDILKEFAGKECYFSVKCDGTSGTFLNVDGEHHVCSRNWSLKETEENTYWQMYHKYNLKDILNDHPTYAIQGEVVGEGIQKNTMKIKGHELKVFNIYDIKAGRLLSYSDFRTFCNKHFLPMVPLFDISEFNFTTVEELVQLATTVKYPCGSKAEGIVIRPIVGFYCKALSGRPSFKVINNEYLLKHNE